MKPDFATRLTALDAEITHQQNRLRYLRKVLPIIERQTVEDGGDIWAIKERDEIAELETALPRLTHERTLYANARDVTEWKRECARKQGEKPR